MLHPARRWFARGVALALVSIATACGLDLSGSDSSIDAGEGPDGAPTADASGVDARPPSDGGGLDAARDTGPLPDAAGADTGSDSCASTVENCENGIDDNCDGLVDCADPMCTAGFECVPEAPSGWIGYYRVASGAYGSTPSACPAGGAPTTLYANPSGAAQCTTCTCGAVNGASCTTPIIHCVAGQTSCQNTADWTAALDDGNCDKPTTLLGGDTSLSCHLLTIAEVSNAGTCTPSQSTFPNSAPFANQVDVCGAAITGGGGCTAGNTCVPKSGAPYLSSVCVEASGAQSCPSGWTTFSAQTYTGANDTRACSSCACGTPNTQCTPGSYTFFDMNACMVGGASPIVVNTSVCQDLSGLVSDGNWSAEATVPVTSGTCTPSGGSPTGSVSPTGQATFCCH